MKNNGFSSAILKATLLLAAVIVASTSLISQQREGYDIHIVQRGETLFKIGRMYGLSTIQMIEHNPSSKFGIRKGDTLYIPSSPETVAKTSSKASAMVATSATPYTAATATSTTATGTATHPAVVNANASYTEADSTVTIQVPEITEISGGQGYHRVGLVLPLTSYNPEDNNHIACLDFYSGFLLGVKNLQESGAKDIELNIYDENNYAKIEDVQNENSFFKNEIIVGPVRSANIEKLLQPLGEKGIRLISPFDPKGASLVDSCSNLLQVPISEKELISHTIDLFCKCARESGSKPLLLYEKGSDTTYLKQAERRLAEQGIEFNEVGYAILEGRTVEWKILSSLDTMSRHAVFVPSNSEAFVNDAVRNLVLVAERRNVELFGLPKWKNFNTIDPLSYHKLSLTLSLQYWADYSGRNPELEKLIYEYRALYGCEPNTYVMQGYDMAKFLLGSSTGIHGINGNMLFKRKNPGSGFENLAAREVFYLNNLDIVVK